VRAPRRDSIELLFSRRSPLLWAALVTWVCITATTAFAQKQTKPPAKSLSGRVAEQKQEIEAQKLLIEQQRELFETQKAVADSLAARIQQLEAELEAMKQRLADLESQAGLPAWESALEERLKQIEEAAKKAPELPPEVVSAGDFPGSIRIPGTDAAVKFGGRIRTSVVLTLDPLGTDDRFLTNSIPVGGGEASGEAKRTNISARASRLNLEFRTPSGHEELRAFFEGDFAGPSNDFRLRHAYAQYLGWIVGQTWSTFSDPLADHEDLDFEGVSSENVIRQPLVRYWWRPTANTRAAGAVETPAVSLTGGAGVNLFPDLIGRLFWGYTPDGHLQVAGVLRQIRGEAQAGDVRSDWAYGGTVSGVLQNRAWNLQDRIIFQVNGGVGIARYINDLNSLGGQDAVFDSTTGALEALPALGWYVAYEHSWKEWKATEGRRLRSTVLWSFVRVYNLDFQAPDAYKKTDRVAANIVFSPFNRLDAGLEYIRGSRTNKDESSGTADQVQVVMLCRF
jgi:TolA-binding protein